MKKSITLISIAFILIVAINAQKSRLGTYLQTDLSLQTYSSENYIPGGSLLTVLDSVTMPNDALGWDQKFYRVEYNKLLGWVVENTINAPVYGAKNTFYGKPIVPRPVVPLPVAPANVMVRYIEKYGAPTTSSNYTSAGFRSRTLVWHCADGKYRSLDFQYENSTWRLESEYESNCIR